jgi:hypothetical protein
VADNLSLFAALFLWGDKMKYTRYDFKKKKNDSLTLLILLISVLAAAFLLGTGISNMIMKQPNSSEQVPVPKNTSSPGPGNGGAAVVENTTTKFIVIQSGFFKNKESAEELKNKLKEQVIPFTIVEGDSIRVMAGIFSEEDSAKIIQLLNEKQIPTYKTIFEINKNELCEAEIAEVIKGNVKILNKLMEKDVASYDMSDFKNWIASSLKAADSKSKNYNVLEELKNYVNSLPKEIGKDKVEENYVFLYNTLKKVTGK